MTTGSTLGDLILLVIACCVYVLLRWAQRRWPDPPPRKPTGRHADDQADEVSDDA